MMANKSETGPMQSRCIASLQRGRIEEVVDRLVFFPECPSKL